MKGRIQQRGSDDNESLLSSWFLGAAGPQASANNQQREALTICGLAANWPSY
jgi:hypothetical protein